MVSEQKCMDRIHDTVIGCFTVRRPLGQPLANEGCFKTFVKDLFGTSGSERISICQSHMISANKAFLCHSFFRNVSSIYLVFYLVVGCCCLFFYLISGQFYTFVDI